MNARADGNAARKIGAAAGKAHADQRFGIGKHIAPQSRRKIGQHTFFFHVKQQSLRAQAAGGHDYILRGEMLLGLLERLHRHPPAGVAFILFVQRFDAAYAAFRQHFRAQLFSQIKIVVIERIFGAVAAAHHAAAAADAGRTRGAFACEIRVALLLRLRMFVIRTEIHRHAGAVKAAAHARFIGQFFQHMVGIGQQRIGGYAEHFFRRAVMPGHFSRPIAQERPSAATPHFFRRHEQGVGINHRPAAHRIAVQHQHMPKQPQRKKAAAKK